MTVWRGDSAQPRRSSGCLSTWVASAFHLAHGYVLEKTSPTPGIVVLLGWRRMEEAGRGDPIAVPPGTAKPNPTPAQPVARLPKASFTGGGGGYAGTASPTPFALRGPQPPSTLGRLCIAFSSPRVLSKRNSFCARELGVGAEGCPGGGPVRGLEAGRDKLTRMSISFY